MVRSLYLWCLKHFRWNQIYIFSFDLKLSVQTVKSLETVVFEQYDEIISHDMQVNNLPVLSMVLV